ncbi:MAG TPA: hypothetical protein VFP65_12135 [Anaeromyxobacteraceae bacterium]|nr:hypothetical protein [Anaeromyxobacteraceae bacterium]
MTGRSGASGSGGGRRVLPLLALLACHPSDAPPPADVLALPPFDGAVFACQDGVPDPPGCAELAQAYAAAAVGPLGLFCNPDASELCNAPRPAPGNAVGDGGAAAAGACRCPIYVSPPHSAALDAALQHFLEAGCHVRCCDCPPGGPAVHACRSLAPGTGTCG